MSRLVAEAGEEDDDVEMTSVQQTVRKVASGISDICTAVQRYKHGYLSSPHMWSRKK